MCLYHSWFSFLKRSVPYVRLSIHQERVNGVRWRIQFSLSPPIWPYSPLNLGPFFSFLILYPVSRIPLTGDQPVARPLPTHMKTQTQNKPTQTSMALVGFEPTITVFERAKTVHALDRATTVIGGEYNFSCVGTIKSIASPQWWFLSWYFSGARPHTCGV
jgi:hypothetical protein